MTDQSTDGTWKAATIAPLISILTIPIACAMTRLMIKGSSKEELMRNFGVNLRKFRKERGLTQYDISHSIGVTQPMISHYENGCQSPTIWQVQRLADSLDIPIAWFFLDWEEK